MYNKEDLGKKIREETLWVQGQLEQAALIITEGKRPSIALPAAKGCLGQRLCRVEEILSHLGAAQPHPTCVPRTNY